MLNDCRLTSQMNFSIYKTHIKNQLYIFMHKIQNEKTGWLYKVFHIVQAETLAGRFTRHKGGKLYKSTDFLRF